MKSMNTIYKKLSLFHYNVGLFNFEAEPLLKGNIMVRWLNHPYRDRFFADPFILDVTENEIRVLVEDLEYKTWKGNISLLVIDRKSTELKRKTMVLNLDTHLSFPFIYRENNEVYVIPENSASGSLRAWRYNADTERLESPVVLTGMPVVDPVIKKAGTHYFLYGSLQDRSENRDLYLWQAEELLSHYELVCDHPIKSDNRCSRRGGDFFIVDEQLYGVAQSCVNSYGEATQICRAEFGADGRLTEQLAATILPDTQYPYGLHTFNVYKGVCVVDGLSYLFRPFKKIGIMAKHFLKK